LYGICKLSDPQKVAGACGIGKLVMKQVNPQGRKEGALVQGLLENSKQTKANMLALELGERRRKGEIGPAR